MDEVNDDGEENHTQGGVVSDTDTVSKPEEENGNGHPTDSDKEGSSAGVAPQAPNEADETLEENQQPAKHANSSQPTNLLHSPTQASEMESAFSYPHQPAMWPSLHPPSFATLPPGQAPVQHPDVLHFYEAQMRDHAVAYANAAAGAAWAAAQIAADMASASQQTNHNSPRPLTAPTPPPHMFPMMMHPPPMYEQPVYYSAGEVAQHHSEDSESFGDYGHRRRKRQQFMPPSADTRLPKHQQQNQQQNQHRNNSSSERRGRRRRRFRNDGSSDTDHQQQQKQQQHSQFNNNSNRRRVRKMALPSSSSDGGSTSSMIKKKQRQPSDESLLGKTGVSALYEWCGKRRTTPTFTLKNDEDEAKRRRLSMVEDFEYIVSVDGMQVGQGRGRTKSAAKQEAARRALQVLLPGVVFEDASGILVELPAIAARNQQYTHHKSLMAKSLEDLAPNLAKRLAIGVDDDVKRGDDEENDITSNKDSKKRHKLPLVYPGTSTTSDEEDENAYYASRGASVCSALLHAMVQIDERIPAAPEYTYQVSTVPSSNSSRNNSQKRKADGPIVLSPPIVIHRGSFTCTGTMKLCVERRDPTSPSYEILKAIGVGGTKREARHTASAKLLALLFPECDGMVQVKKAAEAAREKYAASKALKQQSKRESSNFGGSRSLRNRNARTPPSLAFAMAFPKSPRVPVEVEQNILTALGINIAKKSQDVTGDEDNKLCIASARDSGLARQLSRQTQLDDRITAALQKLNEQDDEGRSLPGELTADDVGRTMLRKGKQEDMHWISRLLGKDEMRHLRSSTSPLSVIGPNTENSGGNESPSIALRLWSSSTIVLLLCRAIAPYEDPPLGAAIMTTGFSMKRGNSIRIAHIAMEPHLPRERFIECLQKFSGYMSCYLENSSDIELRFATLRKDDIREILSSHLPSIALEAKKPIAREKSLCRPRQESLVATTLQSVQEEGEGAEESDSCPETCTEKRNTQKDEVKPSKRSRVQ